MKLCIFLIFLLILTFGISETIDNSPNVPTTVSLNDTNTIEQLIDTNNLATETNGNNIQLCDCNVLATKQDIQNTFNNNYSEISFFQYILNINFILALAFSLVGFEFLKVIFWKWSPQFIKNIIIKTEIRKKESYKLVIKDEKE